MFNWGMRAVVGGRPLVAHNPLKGYRLPKERNSNRPVITEAQYQPLLSAAGQVDWRMRLMLILANETGHRLGAIRPCVGRT